MSASFDGVSHEKLPPEILSRIFRHLNSSSSSLFNCILCCKLWRQIGEEVLYRHVVLDDSNLSRFVKTEWIDNAAYGKIHSLTIRVGNSPKRYPWSELQDLGKRTTNMKRLRSFSFKRYEPVESQLTFQAVLVLISILENLPPWCSALEIDDPTARRPPKIGHLCPAIYNNLWKLEYLRVRWPWLCSDLFGPKQFSTDGASNSHDSKSKPSSYPLCHCVIDAINIFGSSAHACRSSRPQDYRPDHPRYAWTMLVERMKQISRTSGPRLEKMMVLSSRLSNSLGPLVYPTFVRHDLLSNTSKAFPYRPTGVVGDNIHSYLMRCSESTTDDFIGPSWTLFPLAEGQTWQETRSGIRLPAPLMKWYELEPYLPVLSREEFRAQGGPTCTLWKNELKTGMQLMVPSEGALEEQPDVREQVPLGWLRTSSGELVEEGSIVENDIVQAGRSTQRRPVLAFPLGTGHSIFSMPVDQSGEGFTD